MGRKARKTALPYSQKAPISPTLAPIGVYSRRREASRRLVVSSVMLVGVMLAGGISSEVVGAEASRIGDFG